MRWDLFEEELFKIAAATIGPPPPQSPTTGPPQVKSPSVTNTPKPPSPMGMANTVPTTKSTTTQVRKATESAIAAPVSSAQNNAAPPIAPLSPLVKRAFMRIPARRLGQAWSFLRGNKKTLKPALKQSRLVRLGVPAAAGVAGVGLGAASLKSEERKKKQRLMYDQMLAEAGESDVDSE